MYSKRKLKPFVLPSLYLIMLIGLVVTIMVSSKKVSLNDNDISEMGYVSSIDLTNGIPVVNINTTIGKPYISKDVKISVDYYDYSSKDLSSAIIYYENTYMPNSGVDYVANEAFDVVSIYNGTVIKVEDNSYLGKTVQIKHDNNIISVYQSLSNVIVKNGDVVNASQIIAKSGNCLLNANTGNYLHFELSHNGELLNPETSYGKEISSFK